MEELTAVELGQKIQKKEISCKEATRHALRNIAAKEQSLNAFTLVLKEQALKRAEQVQKKVDTGECHSPLMGVPMAIKDNILTKGYSTTCASKMLEHYQPPYSASAYEKLEKAGGILLGKLNMDEFAMGGSSETSYFGPVKNPWDTSRVPGGSSGGSAVAVAAGESFFTLGSDTGGSIRQPCSFCGVTGIKPTYGSVSRYGLVAFASSLDQIGPVGKSVMDCAEILKLIGGKDKKDSTSMQLPPWKFDYSGDIHGMKIGVPENFFAQGIDDDVKREVFAASRTLESMGARLIPLQLDVAKYAVPAYYVLACAEASSNLSRYDGVKYGFRSDKGKELQEMVISTRSEGFGMEVKRRIMLGSFVLSSGYYDAYYKKGMQARELIQKAYCDALEQCDVILAPTAPTVAYKIGENVEDPLKMYLGDVYTVSVNLAGMPAISLPCGFGDNGMPVGMQLIGRAFEEETLVKVGHAFQLETDYHKKRPGGAL